MFRVVADTNVVVQIRWQGTEDRYRSNGYQESPVWEFLRRFSEDQFALLMTVSTLLELSEKLLEFGVDIELVGRLLDQLRLRAVDVAVPIAVGRYCTDPDDDKFIEAAIHGRASHLVTGDRAIARYVTDNQPQLDFRIVKLVGFLRELRASRK